MIKKVEEKSNEKAKARRIGTIDALAATNKAMRGGTGAVPWMMPGFQTKGMPSPMFEINVYTGDMEDETETDRYKKIDVDEATTPDGPYSVLMDKKANKTVDLPQSSPKKQEAYDKYRFDLLKKLAGDLVNKSRQSLWKK